MIVQADYDAAVEVAATRMRGLREAIELLKIQAEQMAAQAGERSRRTLRGRGNQSS